jgi:ABC-2 type transport system ATP-binding protein
MPHAVEIRGLEKRYKNFTLGPLDLTVPQGAIYGFVGPNGSGKTTTIDLMFGMGSKDAGSISVLGFDHRADEVEMKRRVGYVSPELNFQAWGRVRNVIHFVRGFYSTWDATYCDSLLGAFHISPDERILALSFGARTKLALVLALSWRPPVLILDEPTTGLDAISKQQVFSELLTAVRNGDRTVFISSHAITDLERFADHVGMIKNGQLIFEGEISVVLDRYRCVDFTVDRPIELADHPGMLVLTKAGNRWRALLDRTRATIEWLKSRGAKDISDAPLTLEELFVALGRD